MYFGTRIFGQVSAKRWARGHKSKRELVNITDGKFGCC